MRFLVTAGPTHEPIDPVRYLSNPSSGKMGYAIAEQAKTRGGEVVLISGPTSLKPPSGVNFKPCKTADEMNGEGLVLKLVPTKDILLEVAQRNLGKLVVGFAAETQNLVESALEKLKKKNLDLIVANDISAPGIGFQSDSNQVMIIDRDENIENLPLKPKRDIADLLLDRILSLLKSPEL